MATNKYVNHYHATNEQNLTEDLIVESIQMNGFDALYIPRNQPNIDTLYAEDPSNTFGTEDIILGGFEKVEIEVYQASVDEFGGDEMFSKFGLDIKDSAVFVMSKRRFKEEINGMQHRPNEGDLMWLPITNSLLEIKFVDHQSPFFQHGKQYVYQITAELFTYSYEEINTGDSDVDSFIEQEIANINDPTTEVEEYGDNDAIDDEGPDLNFDPTDPFGVR